MQDQSDIQARLLKLKTDLLATQAASSESRQPVELDQQAVGRVSRIDAIQQQAMAIATERRRQNMLQRIAAALQRVEHGRFGYCVLCDEEIGEARLALDPTIATCMSCAGRRD